MKERNQAELVLLRTVYPNVVFREEDGWALLPEFAIPQQVWDRASVEVAFRFPELLGQPPYAFFVRPSLSLRAGGSIQNYGFPAPTPFGNDFGQFSWTPDTWAPAASVALGSNMLRWVESFKQRLGEGA